MSAADFFLPSMQRVKMLFCISWAFKLQISLISRLPYFSRVCWTCRTRFRGNFSVMFGRALLIYDLRVKRTETFPSSGGCLWPCSEHFFIRDKLAWSDWRNERLKAKMYISAYATNVDSDCFASMRGLGLIPHALRIPKGLYFIHVKCTHVQGGLVLRV